MLSWRPSLKTAVSGSVTCSVVLVLSSFLISSKSRRPISAGGRRWWRSLIIYYIIYISHRVKIYPTCHYRIEVFSFIFKDPLQSSVDILSKCFQWFFKSDYGISRTAGVHLEFTFKLTAELLARSNQFPSSLLRALSSELVAHPKYFLSRVYFFFQKAFFFICSTFKTI